MNPTVEQRNAEQIRELKRVKAGLTQGEVSAVSPLKVKIGGSEVSVLATALDGKELQIGDRVSILVQGSQILVQGKNTDDPQDAGGGADSVPDATGSVKGKVKLTGDLGGTADSPTVPGLASKVDTGDSRLSDQRTPTDGSVTAAKVNSSLKPSGSASGTDESLRRLGTGSTHAAAGDDVRFPSAGEKNALAGTSGTPGSGNKYVTDGDSRNSNARTPTSHASSHGSAGSDPITVAQSQVTGLTSDLAANSTGDRNRANHTGTQLASTISNFDTQVRTSRLNQMATPNASVGMGSQKITSLATGTAGTDGVNLAQMEVAILEAQAGYTRLPDVDKAPTNFNWAGGVSDWSGVVVLGGFATRSGNVITGAGNGLLRTRDYLWGGLQAPDAGDAVQLGDELLLTQDGVSNGLWVVTRTGSPSQTFQLTRRSDADTTGELVQFNIVRAANNGAQYQLTTANTITINTTSQTWEPYSFFPSEHAWTHGPDGTDPILGLGLGVLGSETLATSFTTSGSPNPHTNYQDEGLNATVTYLANRVLRITIKVNPSDNGLGGPKGVRYRLVRGSTAIPGASWQRLVTGIESECWQITFDGPGSGATENFKVQVCNASANTAVQSFGSTDFNRQLIIEDLGPQ